MNNTLLENPNFKKTLSELLKNNINDLKDTDPGLKWNIIKNRVKELAQQFGKFNKIKEDQNKAEIRYNLNSLEKQLVSDCENIELQNKILFLKNKLEILNIKTAEAAKIRSKAKWIEEGEKCTNFF